MSRNHPTLIFAPRAEINPVEKIALAFCLYISFCLILRLWLRQRDDRWTKKLFWSVVLLLPLIGWVFYGAFYTPLASGDTPCEENRNVRGGGGSV